MSEILSEERVCRIRTEAKDRYPTRLLSREIVDLCDGHERLRKLFAVRTEHDDKSILDDLDVATGLLTDRCGEVGFALANSLSRFVEKARAALGEEAER